MSLKKGMKVKIVTEEPFLSEIKNEVGTVREIYDDMGVAIVKILGGGAKVPIEFLEEVKKKIRPIRNRERVESQKRHLRPRSTKLQSRLLRKWRMNTVSCIC